MLNRILIVAHTVYYPVKTDIPFYCTLFIARDKHVHIDV